MFVDSHAHLTDDRFREDRDKIIDSFKEYEIDFIINPGTDLNTSIQAVALAEKYPNIYAAVGFHPHDAKDMDESSIEILKSFASREKVVAIGEIGLDFHYDNSPRDLQRTKFKEQIQLAKDLDLPIIVHSREADEEVYKIIKDYQDGSLKGVMHCYSGSPELAKRYIDLGFYISLAGPVTFKNGQSARELARQVDINRLLIETDSPYLTPEPYRGKRNEPIYVRYVASRIAEEKGIDIESLAKITNQNTRNLFNI